MEVSKIYGLKAANCKKKAAKKEIIHSRDIMRKTVGRNRRKIKLRSLARSCHRKFYFCINRIVEEQ
jgi:hypothetical protein